MEISAKKTKLMTNNTIGINTEIKVNGQKLETVTTTDNSSIDKVETKEEKASNKLGKELGNCIHLWKTNNDTNTKRFRH